MTQFAPYISIAQAIGHLFNPLCEVVIHNLKTQKIEFIVNNLSRRTIGDDSLLGEGADWHTELSNGVIYEKINWDGRRLKSITSVLYNPQKEVIGLFCINMDISSFAQINNLIESFLKPLAVSAQPDALFRNDWQERIHQFVHTYIQENNLSLASLGRPEKKNLVELLYKQGAFNGKKAANYVADVLGIGRATVYKYLTSSKGE